MGTFVILLLIVFVPFIWFVIRALRYTSEIIGEHSPLYGERTYQVSASQYFLRLSKLMLLFLFVQMLALGRILFKEALRLHNPWLILFALSFVGVTGFIVYFFYIDWHYWTITRNVRLTLNPFEPSIHVDSPDQVATLTPDSLQRIESHRRKSDNYKDLFYDYGYYLFYGNDGSVIRINRAFFLHIPEFMERFFSQVPESVVWHKLPPVKPILGSQN